MARIALAKSHSKWAARLYSQRFPLSFRPSEARGEIYFLLHFSAAIGFQAATGGAPLGSASLRPLPESTASSLRDKLVSSGPLPLPSPGVDMSALWQPESYTSQRNFPVISSDRRESRNLSPPRPIPPREIHPASKYALQCSQR